MKNLFLVLLLLIPFSFVSCEDDPCEDVECVNGACANGECNCEEGWEGSDCSVQTAPANIILSEIVVREFPPTREDGGSWDLDSGADLFVELSQGGTILHTSSEIYDNADHETDHSFSVSPTVSLDPTKTYLLEFFDDDGINGAESLGGIEFVPYNANNGFPSMMEVNAGEHGAGLRLSYTFD